MFIIIILIIIIIILLTYSKFKNESLFDLDINANQACLYLVFVENTKHDWSEELKENDILQALYLNTYIMHYIALCSMPVAVTTM